MIQIEDIADDHLHTTVSDGDLSPHAVLDYLAGRTHGPISITDHDTIGVHKDPGFGAAARDRGLTMVVGTEMDALWGDIEVHVLGFGLDPLDGPLNRFLDSVARGRRQRAAEEMDIVNGLLGEGTFTEEDIFPEGRETLMKPHFIKPMLARGLFPDYRAALKWYKANVNPPTKLAKPGFELVVDLLKGAGAVPVLAHPGYYVKDRGLELFPALEAMKAVGLEGVEVDYPYYERSKNLFSPEAAREMVETIREATVRAGLRQSRGTDCHTLADFEESYPTS